MTISLATLKSRLQADVPARDSIPSSEQYERCIKDAVADYSARRPLRKKTQLSIVSGTASYDLPDDFLTVITLAALTAPTSDVLYSSSGLIPVSATYSEDWYVVDGQITFDPTPQYTLARDLWYSAAYVLDDSDEYADMGESVARCVMLRAAWQALTMQANKAAQEAWQYAIGDERVNKEKLAQALRQSADQANAQYLAALEEQIGPAGSRGAYTSDGIIKI